MSGAVTDALSFRLFPTLCFPPRSAGPRTTTAIAVSGGVQAQDAVPGPVLLHHHCFHCVHSHAGPGSGLFARRSSENLLLVPVHAPLHVIPVSHSCCCSGSCSPS